MILEDLQELPSVDLAEGYHLRSYLPGDEQDWLKLICDTFMMTQDDAQGFANDIFTDSLNPSDVLFISCGKSIVATATAKKRPDDPPDTGYVHMVAVDPAHRGKHLGANITLAVLHRLAGMGYKKAILHTDDYRTSAVVTYLRLGFKPVINDTNMESRWLEIGKTIGVTITR